jgi:hypothetical protein
MASPFDSIKRLVATKQGKVVAGGTAVGGVVVAGLLRRRKAKGDPAAPGDASKTPYTVAGPASGTSGSNVDAFPMTNTPGIDVGQFEQLLSELGRLADAADANANTGGDRTPPTPDRWVGAVKAAQASSTTAATAPRPAAGKSAGRWR